MTRAVESAAPLKKRWAYLDALRIAAAFLVIVNHTNSGVFQASSPAHSTWYLSVLWYYVSKTAVPLFVMISGACLLPGVDGYRKAGARALRVLVVLLVFSYVYFLHDAWVNYGLWPRAMDFGVFLSLVWEQRITDSFWYLYFYLGMLVMLPLLQRMARQMEKRDLLYLMGVSFGVNALWPLLAHYAPGLALPSYFDVPACAVYIGLFFAGHYVHRHVKPTRRKALGCAVMLAVSLVASLWLTYVEYGRLGGVGKYWFMDDRMLPSLFTIMAAVSVMVLAKGALQRPLGERTARVLMELGSCAFGVYLLQDLAVAETKERLFAPLYSVMPSMAAVLIWEAAVFAFTLAAAWMLRRVPLLKKVL